MRGALLLAMLLLVGFPDVARAWSRPGHMVTAAIAYDEIGRRRPDLLPVIAALLDAHPDRAPFEVAIDRTTGAERQRRMFLECARWPDDARETVYDHPTWHASASAVVAADAGPAVRADVERRQGVALGDAVEAFALNVHQFGNRRASPAERAQALCWVLHIVGDIHQPLHTAERFSAAWPDGDRGGGLPQVLDPLTHQPISLHWLWDDSVHRSGAAADVDRRAREVAAAHPRPSLPQLSAQSFLVWRRESYELAQVLAYGPGPSTSRDPKAAPAVTAADWSAVRAAAETRVALAGYRMADTVIAALDASR